MAEYGVQTWDASGKVNNYGVKPVSVCGYLQLAQNQKTGSYTVALPPGCRLTCFQVMNGDQFGTSRRKITISGGTATVSAAGDTDYSAGTEPAAAAYLIFQIERA
ncbi:hypothetical protein DJ539_00580 [Enterobacter hormaechei]|uniref:hypothetical protein n=1 Tax=Enterobacter hormaechei TaxID=158836 RepID=UPI0011E3E4A8|nr:hypothetical protein [Enterobacter hormaechei]TYF78441.1 hypothetical protein DJ539_00580 [Enterobacter hormaechei]